MASIPRSAPSLKLLKKNGRPISSDILRCNRSLHKKFKFTRVEVIKCVLIGHNGFKDILSSLFKLHARLFLDFPVTGKADCNSWLLPVSRFLLSFCRIILLLHYDFVVRLKLPVAQGKTLRETVTGWKSSLLTLHQTVALPTWWWWSFHLRMWCWWYGRP